MIQNRVEVEDFMHDVIAKILPHIDKSNIRPAFQKTSKANPAGMNYISQDGITDGLRGFTNTDNFVYFKVLEDYQNSSEAEVDADDTASFIQDIQLIVYIYGEYANRNAVLLKALFRTDRVQTYLNLNGYYQTSEGSITPLSEDINGEWWDRVDVSFNLSRKVILKTPKEDAIEYSKGYNTGEQPNILIDGEVKDAQ